MRAKKRGEGVMGQLLVVAAGSGHPFRKWVVRRMTQPKGCAYQFSPETEGLRERLFILARVLKFAIIFFIIFLQLGLQGRQAFGAQKWTGVDESVVEKYAKEHGREARDPFINTDKGDLLLFVFLLAGAVGGFVAGYYWRVLISIKEAPKGSGEIQK